MMTRTLAISVIFTAVAAAQAVLEVPSQFPSIEAAVAAAQEADVVRVAPGVYEESVDMRYGIQLIGSGAGRTEIRSRGAPAIIMRGSMHWTATVQGFTITSNGHGIVALEDSDAQLHIADCDIRGQGVPGTVGIFLERLGCSEVSVSRCRIRGWTGQFSSGVSVGVCDSLDLFACTISENERGVDGAMGGGISMEDCVIHDNSEYGVSIWGGTMTNCTVARNGDGVFAVFLGADNCIFFGNSGTTVSTIPSFGNVAINWSTVEGTWPGTGNLSADPQFTDAAAGDFTLGLGSPARDAGQPTGSVDPDGTRTDQGARAGIPTPPGFSRGNNGTLPCFEGPPIAWSPLEVNGSDGGLARRVDVAAGQPITISVQPLGAPGNPWWPNAPFALLAYVGTPAFDDQVVVPALGGLTFPLPGPLSPNSHTLANNAFADPTVLTPSTPGSWQWTLPNGLATPDRITLQAVFAIDAATFTGPCSNAVHWRTSNAVLVNVY